MRRASWWRSISQNVMRDYLYGVGSVIDPLPKSGSYKIVYLGDEEAIASDWAKVGMNLRHALWMGADNQHLHVSHHGDTSAIKAGKGKLAKSKATGFGAEPEICEGAS
jgi:hypothetical protein